MNEETLLEKFVKNQEQESITRFEKIISRITRENNFKLLNATSIEAFINSSGETLIFFLDNPIKRAEAVDLAVLIPELVTLTQRLVNVGILCPIPGANPNKSASDPQTIKTIMNKFVINRLPSILFLRDGGYLGSIIGLKNWSEYQSEISQIINNPVSEPPAPVSTVTEISQLN